MTIIKLNKVDAPYLVKESFNTIRNRLCDESFFCVITLEDHKMFVNKTIVEFIAPFKAENVQIDKQESKKKNKKG